MFIYKKTIYLHETDATGVLFFSEQFKIAVEALETYFLTEGFTIKQMLEEKEFVMPIVHAEANFLQPLCVGDQVEIHLELEKIGQSAFTICSRFYHSLKKIEMGNAKIVHVTVSKKTKKSIPIPKEVELLLQGLLPLQGSGVKNEDFGNLKR